MNVPSQLSEMLVNSCIFLQIYPYKLLFSKTYSKFPKIAANFQQFPVGTDFFTTIFGGFCRSSKILNLQSDCTLAIVKSFRLLLLFSSRYPNFPWLSEVFNKLFLFSDIRQKLWLSPRFFLSKNSFIFKLSNDLNVNDHFKPFICFFELISLIA